MERMKSLSEKRPIIEATLEGKEALFLLDTGATVGILSKGIVKKYGLKVGRDFGKLVGAGGEFRAKYCHSFATLRSGPVTKPITQFLIGNIDQVIESIREQTGIEIQGIISYPQMQFAGVVIDTQDNSITF